MNLKHLLTTIIFWLILVSTQASANLIVNGSFENGNYVPDVTAGDMLLYNGSNTITGWTVLNDLSWMDINNPFLLTASDGIKFLDLTEFQRTAGFGGVSQTITTIIGQNYTLSFDIGSSFRFGALSSIKSTAGSTSANFTATNTSMNDVWETFSLDFVALSNSTEIKLEGLAAGAAYIGLDNVSVKTSIVSEPTTLILMGLGLVCLGFPRGINKTLIIKHTK